MSKSDRDSGLLRRPGPRRLPWAWLGVAAWGVYFAWLWPRMLFERGDGLYAGWRTVWADFVAHFAYANVFALRPPSDWFDSHPLFAGRAFDYPFFADALSGLLMRAGVDRIDAFVVPSLVASLLLVVLLQVFYRQQLGSSGRALLATTLFFTNGGLGFLLAFGGAPRPREYTWLPEQGIEWINLVSSELLPQRAILFGLPLGLGILSVLGHYRRREFAGVSHGGLVLLGVGASLLLLVHAHSYLALVVLCAALFAADLRNPRPWLVFAVAAALPSLLWLRLFYGESGGGDFFLWEPGWLAHAAHLDMPLGLFLWLNWGVFLPLAAVAVVRLGYWRQPLVLGGLALFVAAFLVRFQPNPWDNTKLLTWSHLLLCIPVAHYLARLGSRTALAKLLALALFVLVTASGALDLWQLTRGGEVDERMFTRQELELAADFQEISSPGSLVLSGDHHHHWVPALAGRPVLLGYRGWLASYGVDYGDVAREVRTMLAGGPAAEALMQRHGVEFVVIGPGERRDFGASEEWFEGHHERVLERGPWKVFRVRSPEEPR